MQTRFLIALFAIFSTACDGALTLATHEGDETPIVIETSGADDAAEVGDAASTESLWGDAVITLSRHTDRLKGCTKRGRWACSELPSPEPEPEPTPEPEPEPTPEPEPEPAPACGDGAVDEGELCDGNCPSSCTAPDACTTALLSGAAETCDAACTYDSITACTSGDGCCPTGCSYDADNDCPMPTPTTPPALDCTDDSTWPQAWKDYEAQVIALVNQRRAAGADCGSRGSFAPAGPVQLNTALRQASRCHSLDMDVNMYFSHTSQDGRNFVTRINEAGYTGSARGENIAAGYSTPEAVMTGWMNSDGHCANIMKADINRMGVGLSDENRPTWTMTTGYGD